MAPRPDKTPEHVRHERSIRLECLRLAFLQSGPTENRMELARKFAGFVLGEPGQDGASSPYRINVAPLGG